MLRNNSDMPKTLKNKMVSGNPRPYSICTAQWSLYVPHSGHYMYRTVVTICTASLTYSNSTFCPHSVFMCFVWISEQTAIISLYNIN